MSVVVDLSAALKAALSADAAARQNAESQLVGFRDQNLASYLASLIAELNNDTRDADVRQIAGVMLKNTVDAHDDARKKELQARWVAVDPNLKQHIRDMLLQCLHSAVSEVRKIAALAVAKIAAIDLVRKEWPNLIQVLLANMGAVPQVTGTRQATLMAMGYVCEEAATMTNETLSPTEVSMVLTAVVAGMGMTEPNESRLAATTALSNAIEFAHLNFENEQERNYLMQVVCQGTQSQDLLIRSESFRCLHEIAAYYYGKLPAYMTELYNITVKAIQSDEEEVGLQAIEFWSTIAEAELDLIDAESEEDPCRNFIAAASPHLVPILLQLLTKQEEGQEQDEAWNIAMAAATCLSLIARVVRDNIVLLVMPFVTTNVSKTGSPEDWRLREAATLAFGTILEGPEPRVLVDTVKQALGFLLQAMKDPHPTVRDTTAWTIGRIFEFLHDAHIEPSIITRDTLPPLISVLLEALKDASHIAVRVCYALGKLAEGFKEHKGDSSPMSPFFKDTVAALLQAGEAHALTDSGKVQMAAFEAINELVGSASRDTLDMVQHLIQVVIQNLQRTLDPANASGKERVAEMQGQLCGMLQVILRRLIEGEDTKAGLLPCADQIMETLLRVLHSNSAGVSEEAMRTVGAFTYGLGRNFMKYMPQFYPYLKMGLTNYQEWEVCLSSVGVLGDVCRNVEGGILPYCDDLVSIMLLDLSREDVNRTIKPQILSGFGDIALVTGEAFEKYLEPVLRVLKQAMGLSVTMQSDVDNYEYNNELRRGIIDSYSGIMQGLGQAPCERCLKGDVPAIVEFVSSIGLDEEFDEDIVKVAVDLMGDLCSVIQGVGAVLRVSPRQEWEKLVRHCQELGSLQSSDWAINQIQHSLRTYA
ncbi:MAG: hypothetical protein WDW38_005680 [Sanguina aurantia]